MTQTHPPAHEPAHEPFEERLRALVARLDLAQRVRLLTGADMWSLHAEPAVGLRRIVLSDGPSGVRGASFDAGGGTASLNLPSPTALAASWDTALARRYGAALAAEARRIGVDVVLGPTINLHRSPLGGRHFEAYAEDPLLTSRLAAAFVRGVQDGGVGAAPKHYVANDAETDRLTVDNRIGERALRELYLAAFEDTVVRERPWLVMSAYNGVNGTTMSESPLLAEPLCGAWGFDGVVVSDWWAVRGTEPAALARQDLAMPGPDGPWGEKLLAAVREGRVPEAVVDEKVLRLLRLAARVGALAGFAPAVAEPPPPEDGRALARETAAAGFVLLRNRDAELPWSAPALGSVAVIGHNAYAARAQGGGSATVNPEHVVSPLAGLRAALPGARVGWHLGALARPGVVPFTGEATTDPVTGAPGARLVCRDARGREVINEHRRDTDLSHLGSRPLGDTATIELTARHVPEATGQLRIGVAGAGRLRLAVDGVELLDEELRHAGAEFGGGLIAPPWTAAPVWVTAGRPVDLAVTLEPPGRVGANRGVTLVLGLDVRTGTPEEEIEAAAAAARAADVALVVVGTSAETESESFDRETLALPGRQDDLVRAVAAANPRTVVVVNAGAPVLMPWREEVAAVLLGWFGGQEFGHALADVLLGTREPGGRLPTTWPATEDDVPVLTTRPTAGRLEYAEGVHVGYRAWLRSGARPAYPFGFGLGYTDWELTGAQVPGTSLPGAAVPVVVRVRNTGARPGKQVVQVYLSRPGSAVERPARWLAGFALVRAAPGATTAARVTLPARAFQHWADGGWHTEPGPYRVHVGFDADDQPLTSEVRVG